MKNLLILFCLLITSTLTFGQIEKGQLHGSFQSDFQYYNEDSIIGATVPAEQIGLNSYANFNYMLGNFSAGIRYEGYLPTLNGYDSRYDGVGIPYKYISYKKDELEVVVGSFYEQFGNGLVLRAYEEKNLGYDNAFEGVKVKYNPINGIYLKGLISKQRSFWEFSDGIIRGIDGEVSINELFKKMDESKFVISIGGSFVSKFQDDNDHPFYNLPENVSASAGRLNLTAGKINFSTEYAYKINDPSSDNGYIYKPGEALIVNTSYSQKGLGVFLSAKRVDNMSYRLDRDATLANLNINYIPDITKAHAYSLAAMYPYATQLNGEFGFQCEVNYLFKKKSTLGGKYGTRLSINFSSVYSIDKEAVEVEDLDSLVIGQKGTDGYTSEFFKIGDELFYQDLNIEISKKVNKKIKGKIIYQNQIYNNSVIHGAGDWHGKIHAHIGIIDVTYKIKSRNTIRFEIQELYTKDQYGEWVSGLIEYNIPNWFFTVMDQYNYGNSDSEKKVHYPKVSIGYKKGTNRIQIGYGKQREGVMCIGGVCRNVPAANGLTLSITSSF